jgi:hypothetical protein
LVGLTNPGNWGEGRFGGVPGLARTLDELLRAEGVVGVSGSAETLLGSSLIRPTSTFREVLVTWFGVAGLDCGENGLGAEEATGN